MNAEDAYDLLARSVSAAVGEADADFSLVLALSGGRDSMTLLNVLARLNLKASVRAVHVNHGLSEHADDWERFCRRACERVGVTFDSVRLDGVNSTAGNLEALARRLRYRALYQFIQAPGALLTAHHLDDQVETYLYRHCRGTGVHGAGAMSPSAPSPVPGVRLMRPLLAVPGQTIEDCARAMNVQWIEDEQNRDERFERNWIRHRLHPMLRQRFSSVDTVIGHNARLFRRAARLCADLACSDYTSAHEEFVSHNPVIFSLEPTRPSPHNASPSAFAPNASPSAFAPNASPGAFALSGSGSTASHDYTGSTTPNADPSTPNASPGAFAHSGSGSTACHNDIDLTAHNDIDDDAVGDSFPSQWPRWRRQTLALMPDYRLDNLLHCFVRARTSRVLRRGVLDGLSQWIRSQSDDYRHLVIGGLNFRSWCEHVWVDDWSEAELMPLSWHCFADAGQMQVQPADLLPVHDLPVLAQDRLRAMAAELSVRPRMPGDSIFYGGRQRAIKKIFHQEAIPPWLRARVPVVCAQSRPLALLLPDRWLADDELTGAQPTSG